MKDLHKAARDLWQQFSDAGVNLNSINFQTLAEIDDGKVIGQKLVNVSFDARLVEKNNEVSS